jgi:hypothetical protein
MNQESAFEKLSKCLHQAQAAPALEQSRTLIAEAIQRVERIAKAVLTAAEKRGRKGGTKTAERGPDYYREIASLRKTRAGGRPSGRGAVQALVSSYPGKWFTREEIKRYVREEGNPHTDGSLNTLISLCTANNPNRPWPRSNWGNKTYADMDYNILFRRGTDDAYRAYHPASDPKPLVP